MREPDLLTLTSSPSLATRLRLFDRFRRPPALHPVCDPHPRCGALRVSREVLVSWTASFKASILSALERRIVNPIMIATLAFLDTQRLVHLSPVDLVIIVFYFALVLAIGFYLKGQANTGEDFFMAGREMTAWVAGLSFLSANLGSLELMGWAGASYQYGILAAHWYWIGAIPAMLFLALVMMPFYYISRTHSVPGYLKLRFGEAGRALSSVSFAFMTVLMSGINMYSMALVLKIVLGWDINFSIWISSVTVAIYVALGGLRSAIFNEVLQFILIWAGALLIPILGLIEAGGWSGLKARIATNWPPPSTRICGARSATSTTIPWASTGPASSSVSARSFPWAIGPPTFLSSSAFFLPKIFAPRKWLPSSAPASK